MAGNFNIWEIFVILICNMIILFYYILLYVNMLYLCWFILYFLFWIQIYRKLHFTNLANPTNPNLNLDCTDYADSCL